jgi:hypothetical protein
MSTRFRTYDDFLGIFPDKPRSKAGSGWLVICPAHNDHNPSLWVTPAKNPDFIADIKCQAGCNNENILAVLKLTWADMHRNGHYGHKNPSSHSEIEAIYHYVDANGKPFEVVRTNPKGFYQRQPDGKGGYLKDKDGRYSMAGIEYAVYHLPEIKTAIGYGDTIWIAEGEKDVDAIWNIGLVATCNPMGAGKWRESYADSLIGANLVIVIPDNDHPGLEHAHNIANSLAARGIRVKLIKPFADAKDVSDWLDVRHTPDELQAIAESTPDFIPGPETLTTPSGDKVTIRCIADIQPAKVHWVWYPYIPKGKLTMLSGDPGDGKSQICMAITAGITKGEGLPGIDPFIPDQVLIATAEDGLADTIRPRLDAFGADISRVFVMDGLFTLDDAGCELLETAISRKHPLLVIIDPLMAYIGEKVDVNKANQVRHVTAKLAALADKYQCAILSVRHLTKSKGTRAVYQGQGNVDLTAAVRSELLAGHDPEDDNIKAIVHIKSNLAKKGPAIGYRMESAGHDDRDCRFSWTGISDLSYSQMFASEEGGTKLNEAMEFLIEILKGCKVLSETISKLAAERGISPATLNRAKKKLGVISKGEYGTGKKGADKWYWEMPSKDDNEGGINL